MFFNLALAIRQEGRDREKYMVANITLSRKNNFKDKYKKMFSQNIARYMEIIMAHIKAN